MSGRSPPAMTVWVFSAMLESFIKVGLTVAFRFC